jgi:hypothetical protein
LIQESPLQQKLQSQTQILRRPSGGPKVWNHTPMQGG